MRFVVDAFRASLAVSLLVSLAIGCGSPPPPTTTVSDGGPQPDSGSPVIRCTRDEECDDLMFCNGMEQCLPAATGADARGCLARTMPQCAAMQICDEMGDQCITDCGTTRDADGDGHEAVRCGGDDCDDSDAHRFPGNAELCDAHGHDEDCDPTTIGTRDLDGDRVIDAECCNTSATGTMNCGTDCDDSHASVNPAAGEICNLIDDDCDGSVDESVLVAGFLDADGDLYGDPAHAMMACPGTAQFVTQGGDCDDDASGSHGSIARSRNPGQPEICDHLDNDCDGTVEENTGAVVWYGDTDGDGFGIATSGIQVSCTPLPGFSLLATDCDDHLVTVSPVAAELCNGLDDNCNGLADFVVAPNDTEDDDRDGYADMRCPVTMPDCDDHDPLTHPTAPELCDGRDNDCNGVVDTATMSAQWYVDVDHDRFGDSQVAPIMSCEPQTGRVPNGADCDDTNPAIMPGARDGCLGIAMVDDDCDMQVDEDMADLAFFVDADGDGYGAGTPVLACGLVAGRVTNAGDCDDLDPTRSPGAMETCTANSTLDVDCDGHVGCDDTDCTTTAACAVSYRVRVVSGDGQTPQITRAAAMPVVFELDDMTTSMPVTGMPITISAAGGGAITIAGVTPDAMGNLVAMPNGSGQVTVTVRGGLRPNTFTVTGRAAHATPATATFTSVPAVNGWAVPIVGTAHASTAPLVGPVSAVQSGTLAPQGIVVAHDGTIYWADYSANAVFRIDASGIQTRVAGGGASVSDGSLATDATVNSPQGLALDESARLLYIAATNRIRVVDLATSRIYTFAGGGSAPAPGYGDDGPATSAQTPGVTRLALAPNGDLYFDTANRIRRVDAAGVVHEVLAPASSCTASQPMQFAGCGGSCGIAWDASGTMFVSGYFCAGPFGTSSVMGIARVEASGAITSIVGSVTGTMSESTAGSQTALAGASPLEFDAGGHLYYADYNAHVVRRVDTSTGRVSSVLGAPTMPGSSGDYGLATSARCTTPYEIAIDTNGTLYVTEPGDFAIRMVPGAGQPTTHASLEIATGGTQTTTIGHVVPTPMGATLRDEGGTPVRGITIDFVIASTGIAPQAATLSAPSAVSGLSGVASVGGRAGLPIGDYHFTASFHDIHGAHVTGSPIDYRVDATAPAAGTIFPILDIARSASAFTPGNSVETSIALPLGIAVGGDGSVYVASYNDAEVIRVHDGLASVFAGNRSSASGVEDVPAIGSSLNAPAAIAFGGTSLYIADGTGRIRYVDTATGLIHRLAGNGIQGAFIDGVDALMTPLSGIQSVAVAPDGGVWFDASGPAIVRVDPATHHLDAMVRPDYVNTCTDRLHVMSFYSAGAGAALTFAPDGTLYFAGIGCAPTDQSGSTNMIFRRLPNGTIERVAGAPASTGSTADGIVATSTVIVANSSMAFDPMWGLVYAEGNSTPRVRAIDPTTLVVRTIVGDQTIGTSGDYGPAAAARVNSIRGIAFTPDHHMILSDSTGYVVREVW